MKKKILITIPSVILLISLYVLIFCFSAEEAEESGSKSHYISRICVETVNKIAGKNWTEAVKEQLTDYYEHPIRKLAHFSEYCLSGILLFIAWSQWIPRDRRFYLFLIIWIAVSAGIDEIHQLLVAGRDGNVIDVMIDTLGGGFGLFFCTLIHNIGTAKRSGFIHFGSSKNL